MKDDLWRCRDGKLLRPKEMTTSHIVNCIAKIDRSRGWRKEWRARLVLELEIRQAGLRY